MYHILSYDLLFTQNKVSEQAIIITRVSNINHSNSKILCVELSSINNFMKESALKNVHSLFSDEELQRLAEQPIFPTLQCSKGHEVTSVCVRSSCNAQTAFCCNDKSCPAASIDNHKKCLNITNMSRLTSLIESQRRQVKIVLLEMLRIESELFNKVRGFSQAVINRYRDEVLQKQHESIVKQLFEGSLKNLSPRVASQLMNSLHRKQLQVEQLESKSIQRYQREVAKLEEILTHQKCEILQTFFGEKSKGILDIASSSRINTKETKILRLIDRLKGVERSERTLGGQLQLQRQKITYHRQNLKVEQQIKHKDHIHKDNVENNRYQAQIERKKDELKELDKKANDLYSDHSLAQLKAQRLELQPAKMYIEDIKNAERPPSQLQSPFDHEQDEQTKKKKAIQTMSAEECFIKGKKLQTLYNKQEALEWYLAANAKDNTLLKVQFNLGILYKSLNRFQESIKCLEKVLEANPNYPEANFMLALLYHKENKLKEAQECIRRVNDIDGTYNEAQFFLGILCQQSNRLAEAQKYYNLVDPSNPNYPQAQYNCAIIYYNSKDMKEAERYFTKAIEKDHLNSQAYFYLGQICENCKTSNRINEAEYFYKKAIEINPNHSMAYTNLGFITYNHRRRLKEAEKLFRTAIQIDENNPDALNYLALLCEETGRIIEAERLYKQIIRVRPDFAEAYNNLGAVCKKTNRINEARKLYLKTIELKPNYGNAYNNLGVLQFKAGRFREAEKLFRKALELRPNQPQYLINLEDTLGEIKVKRC